MGVAGFITKVAVVTITDGDRGLILNRGTHVEAHPEFFKRYGLDFVTPKEPFDAKTGFKMTILDWKPEEASVVEKNAKAPKVNAPTVPKAPEAPTAPAAEAPKKAAALTSNSVLTGKASKKGK